MGNCVGFGIHLRAHAKYGMEVGTPTPGLFDLYLDVKMQFWFMNLCLLVFLDLQVL